jgi:MoxR-like ATPase
MNTKLHEKHRDNVRKIYTAVSTTGVYYNSRGFMQFSFKDAKGNIRKNFLDPMTSSAIVNALVPKSGVIYRGGHGGGKTTMVEKVSHMLTSIPEEDISRAMIRGNDDQNVNTLLATLKFGDLMTKGEENITWRKFVESPVKIIDEINRFPPPAQNALFEILNRGRVEFLDHIKQIDDFMVFATENPNDAGTYPLSKPFVDRFSFCVPAPQIPSAQDQYLLAERIDDKIQAIEVESIMTMKDLKEIREAISKDIKMSSDSLIYSIYLTQALSTCERGDYKDKSHNDIGMEERCKGCDFDTTSAVCKMTETGVSGRAFLDFQRWGKAYAFLIGAFPNQKKPEVQLETIETIAPFLMYHRLEPNDMILCRAPYFGERLRYIQDIVAKVTQAYNTVKDPLKEVPQILRGDIDPTDAKLQDAEKDIVIKHHFLPLIMEAGKDEFRDIYNEINKIDQNYTSQKMQELETRLVLETELQPHATKYLLSKALSKKSSLQMM